ncbi:hypothetical protein [Streptomyces lavendulae]|uniref:hypothetical protein n=1 Tax=Streptomyces lavendulae TaxID=1914 RepID=UPI0024A31FE9|nr:hypothetical protein [Streptomyces lavendulae]GLW03698.1 hypothetical protein Slala05_73280 [Streptomyces lavendulae subsp. lavendulae]
MAALPVNIPTVTVHGTYVGPDARALAGTVTFSAPNMLTFPDSDLFIAGPVVAVLDENGRFEVKLPATDAPGMNPSGWAYVVKENLSGVIGGRTFSLLLPRAKPDVDLADLAPADPTTPNYQPVAGSQVLTGAAVPAAALGRDGDFYTQYDTRTLLGVTHTTVTMWTRVAGAWSKVGGDVRGSQWYVNTTTTPSTDAKPGDMLLRADSGDIWQRSGSGWGAAIGNLKGPKGDVGAAGSKVYAFASGAEASGVGVVDDFAIRTDTGTLYQYVAGTGWTSKGSIKGPKGDTGATGPQGPKGDPGNGSVNKVNGKLGPDVVLVAADVGAIPATEKGAASGVATLDAGGKVPAAQLSTPAGVVTSVNTKPGPTVTLTAADVSALAATARAAANGVAPLDSGSRVPVANLPDLAIPDEWAPADLGLKAWSFDPATAISSPAFTGNGTLRFVAVVIRETVTVSKIAFHFGGYSEKLTAGSWAGIYTTAGALKGATADMAGVAVVPGVHNAGGATVGAALTASVSLTPGVYYVGFVFRYAASDGPMLLQLENGFGAPPNVFGLNNVKRFGVWNGAVATTPPASFDPANIDNGANRFWVGLA